LEQLGVDRLCGGVMIVIFVSQSKEGPRIKKDFQGY